MATTEERMAALEQRIRALVHQRVANVVYVAPYKLATATGVGDGLAGRPGVQESQRQAHRYQHAGFRSRPLAEAQAVALLVEGGASKLAIVAEDDGHDPELDRGEAVAYSPATPAARTLYDKDGNVVVSVAAGKLLELAGDTDFLVLGTTYRDAEHTFFQALHAYFTAMATAFTALAGYAPFGATLQAAMTTASTAASTAAAAAAAMEAGASSYLSTKAKTG